MQRILSSQLAKYIGEQVLIHGWLYKKRELGGMTFLIIRDRGGLVQVVDENSEESKKLEGLHLGTVLKIEGEVVEDKRAKIGVEIHNPKIIVDVPVEFLAPIEMDKPIDHKPENLDSLYENKVLNMRNETELGIWKIQAGVGEALREYFKQEGFTEFHSPKILAGATEGGAEVFKFDYFGKEATLAQSPQFYKQMAVGSLERVYEIGPVYRAEPSTTSRHMAEYISVDGEMGFIESLEDVLDFLSGQVNYVCEKIWERHESELMALKSVKPILKQKFPQITMKDLHELYLKETKEDLRAEPDPTPAEERFICEFSAKNWGSEAVFVTEFPASHMKFYHYANEKNPEVAERADLIFRGVEVVTTSRREHRYAKLVKQLKDMGGDPEHPGFKYFLQAFKYGMPSHGGFGMGLERLTQKIIGLNNVKEASLFPRDMNRLAP